MTEAPFPFTLLNAAWGIPDARNTRFERSDYEICTVEFIVRGRGILECDGRRYECGPDSVYFLHRHGNHRYWADSADPWNKLFLTVDGTLVDQLLNGYGLAEVTVIAEAPQLRGFFESMLQLGYSGETVNWRAAVTFHQFAEACAEILKERDTRIRPEIAELKGALDRSIGGEFHLEAFSRKLGFTSAHLIRRFRDVFGCSPYEYRMRQRVEAARRLLSYSTMSVKEIAAQLGFSDQYSFSNCFKARTGKSPTLYRTGH